MNKTKQQKNQSKNLLQEILGKYATNQSLEILVSNKIIRKNIIKFALKKIRAKLLKNKKYPHQVQEDKYCMVKSMILAADKAFQRAKNAPKVRKALVNSFTQNIFLKEKQAAKKFEKIFHRTPPGFLTISPTKFCNLRCAGCYANSSSANSKKLDWDILNKIVAEKTNLWSSYFTVISGGEPLLYKSKGKTIIDLAKKHQNNYFLMYTNGTLINKKIAKKLAEVGNITPAISVEGYEKETDARRGKGVHKKILQAMKNLREVGVPFGISITASKDNSDLVVSDEFIDYYFDKQGAIYGWIFQLMPIGRAESLDFMVTPEQRIRMFRKTQHLVKDREIFIADFWNSGCVSNGCISAGLPGGYLYIEWNGNVTPCVFNPYSPVNIHDVYKKGGTLNDVLDKPFFTAIRQWQKDYALDKKPNEMGNWLIPCAIKDHYDMMDQLLKQYKPKPIDKPAEKVLNNSKYQKGLKQYGKKVAKAIDPIWQKEYLEKF
ncbi:radical SAM protein [bacterium]|nr:radical SAM protein [bacterium]